MASRNRTAADAGSLAAGLLVEACRTGPEGSLRLEVVRDLALDLERRLDALSHLAADDIEQTDPLIEAALACADLATLAACNLPALPDDGKPLGTAAVYLASGAARALVALVEYRTGAAEDPHSQNTLKDARGARWRADLAAQQIEEAPA